MEDLSSGLSSALVGLNPQCTQLPQLSLWPCSCGQGRSVVQPCLESGTVQLGLQEAKGEEERSDREPGFSSLQRIWHEWDPRPVPENRHTPCIVLALNEEANYCLFCFLLVASPQHSQADSRLSQRHTRGLQNQEKSLN